MPPDLNIETEEQTAHRPKWNVRAAIGYQSELFATANLSSMNPKTQHLSGITNIMMSDALPQPEPEGNFLVIVSNRLSSNPGNAIISTLGCQS
ncbi:hypothetical protein WAI453_001133 [Rhynchosporium graminicola]